MVLPVKLLDRTNGSFGFVSTSAPQPEFFKECRDHARRRPALDEPDDAERSTTTIRDTDDTDDPTGIDNGFGIHEEPHARRVR